VSQIVVLGLKGQILGIGRSVWLRVVRIGIWKDGQNWLLARLSTTTMDVHVRVSTLSYRR